jgi:hypothetical protein
MFLKNPLYQAILLTNIRPSQHAWLYALFTAVNQSRNRRMDIKIIANILSDSTNQQSTY